MTSKQQMIYELQNATADEYNHGLDALDRVAMHVQSAGFAYARAWVRGDDSKGMQLRGYADAANVISDVREMYLACI